MDGTTMSLIHYLHLFIIRTGKPVARLILELALIIAIVGMCWLVTEQLARYCPIFPLC